MDDVCQVQWGSEIQTSMDFEWGKRCLFANDVDFEIGSQIRKPDHLNTDQNGHHLVFII